MRTTMFALAAVVGLLTAAPAHAAPMVTDPQPNGDSFLNYLASHGFGYLDPARVLSDGAVACVNDRHDIADDLIMSVLTSRAYTEDEAKAVIAAERQASPQLC